MQSTTLLPQTPLTTLLGLATLLASMMLWPLTTLLAPMTLVPPTRLVPPAALTHRGPRVAPSLLLAMLLALPAGVRAGDDPVREYVDEITAASITVAVESLVFARERLDLAANARDYVVLAPIEVNIGGKRSYFWSGYVWSTIDRRDGQPLLVPGDQLVLVADGRPIRLQGDAKSARDHGVGQPPNRAPARTAVPVLFTATTESIAYVAHATDLHLQLIHADTNEPFTLWKDARGALRAFSERIGAD